MHVVAVVDARTDNPLAQNFDITQGSVDVKVPSVGPGNEYIIVCEYSRSLCYRRAAVLRG